MTPKIKAMTEREAVEYDAGHIESSAFIVGATFMHSYYAPKLKKAIEALEFYASLSTWGTDMPDTRTAVDPSDHERVRLSMGAPDIRGGKRARQALAELSEDFSEAKPL